ncbi:type I secretion system permease/ATPase [Leisingera sp. HS039]|uniref:type I secretion system permease/ATPase n=1 Tax=unclassified Leisingera TaxID=2614906 RepID=UPI001070F2DC|nr:MULTISPECIES: type I secretion system permease/ATPase [unclassified Leisingera]MBQ4824537.1 type I secretion system permease/ATPase [Leisingera sp. HS039]QBR38768.1 type I secretion system permease/ATPase [Leisingera sp. NJS201]
MTPASLKDDGECSPGTSRRAGSLVQCLAIWAGVMQIPQAEETVRKLLDKKGDVAEERFARSAARALKLRMRFHNLTQAKLEKQPLPLILRDKAGAWFLLASLSDQNALIQRPDAPAPEALSREEFAGIWSGKAAVLRVRERFHKIVQKFDIRWFLPELTRYKGLAFEILAASAAIECLALISPLFFQVIMDKVLVHNSVSTLDVLVVTLIAVAVFEVALKTLRQYLATRTATRIDARLGGNLYRHLVDLPLTYFKSRPVGVTVARVNELSSIREFITGAANTLVIDLSFTFIFFTVMYYYSPVLTFVVLASVPCYMAVSFLITGPLQRRIEELYRDGAVNTSFLTEMLTGVETVKALALEAQMIRRWEYQTRDFVLSNYKVQRLMQLSNTLVQAIQKLTMVLVLWIGARKVIGLELSIGQLIAFNMMANHVSQPVLRLTELWRQFVQTRVSVERLGDVLHTIPEVSKAHKPVQRIAKGAVSIQNVTFRYAPDGEPVLQDFNLEIPGGQMVAFVGRSGSGKSTVARLVQKLYIPETGKVCIDGTDIATLDSVSLRQNTSIVLQENFLFNRSVRDNIALTRPSAPLADIAEAAVKAGAHEFILEMKDGYDTILSEGGSSISGGQRQRIAIARSLLSEPGILILDEATSALDDHSQALIQKNMDEIRKGRTVIVIAHRLSTVRDCDCIHVLDQGRIIESGTHDTLIRNPDGAYRNLWNLQKNELAIEGQNPKAAEAALAKGEADGLIV